MFRRRNDTTAERRRMVEEQLRSRGIRDPRVLEVMERIPRERFLPPDRRSAAYRDRALPLAEGQTISQPYMVAAMTEALRLEPDHRVLEVGTGSGYQTAILSELAREVYTVERLPRLAERARAVLDELGCRNVYLRVGDGTLGWPEEAPFDAILVTAGAPSPPAPLLDQLNPEGGTLVIPVGDRDIQDLVRIVRRGGDFSSETLMACRFVPLVGEEGWSEPDEGW